MGLDKIVELQIVPLTRLHLTVYGRVQGVGFRVFARREASRLGLAGWVRNLDNGAVEIEAEGTEEALETFEQVLRNGHSYAKVEKIETQAVARKGQRGPESFDII